MAKHTTGPYSTKFPERHAAELVARGIFRVDPDGSVWRLKIMSLKGPLTSTLKKPRRVDLNTRTGHRYIAIGLPSGSRCKVQVSRLVWQLAHGDIPAHLTVNHKDGDASNNRLDNLELLTPSEQHKHRFHVLGQEPSGTRHKRLLASFAAAARTVLDTGDLDALKAVLTEYEAGPPGGIASRR